MEFPRPSLEEFYRTYNVGTFDVNSEETRIAFAANLSGKFNLWGADLPNTFPYPLTYQDQSPQFVKFDPQGRYILTSFDKDGDENAQLYMISPEGGALVPLREVPGKRHDFGTLSKDGNRVYYTSDKDNDRFMNVYRYHIESGEEEVLVEGSETSIQFEDVAPDESSFAYANVFSNTHVFSYVVIDGNTVCLTPPSDVPYLASNCRYVDNETILFITNYDSAYAYLAEFNVKTRSFQPIFKVEGQDISDVVISEKGQVCCIASHGVEDVMYWREEGSGEFHKIDFPGSVVFRVQLQASGRLYALLSQENIPNNLYRRELDGSWTRLTNVRVLGAAEHDLGRAETLHYPSFDGLMIEGLLWKAPSDRRNGHTLIFPHGGPQASDKKYFWSLYQYLLSEGYDIFQANYRGSTGYGAEFTKMIERDWGGAPRKDMLAGIEYLIANNLAERDKLFVIGGSFGGYMTLLLHGRHADYFRAAVDIFGPSNLFTFVESVPEFWKPIMDAWVGNPERDKEKMTEDSPITYLDGMTRPMLVIQGANDPRVVKAESDQIVEKLRAANREVEYMVLEDEGHGFSKKENELKVYQAVADFLKRHQAKA